MEVENEADLLEWLKLTITQQLETDDDASKGLYSPAAYVYYDDAKNHLLQLNLLDAMDSLGDDPPRVACVPPETYIAITKLVRGKLRDLLLHLRPKGRGRRLDPKVTKRRAEVKRRLGKGEKPGAISAAMQIGVDTVKNDTRLIKKKQAE